MHFDEKYLFYTFFMLQYDSVKGGALIYYKRTKRLILHEKDYILYLQVENYLPLNMKSHPSRTYETDIDFI